jgi:hypothetical protein
MNLCVEVGGCDHGHSSWTTLSHSRAAVALKAIYPVPAIMENGTGKSDNRAASECNKLLNLGANAPKPSLRNFEFIAREIRSSTLSVKA